MKKRVFSILMCLCMALSLLPMSALAADASVCIGITPLVSGKYYTISGNVVTELDKAPENGGYLSCTLDGTNISLEVTGDVSYSDSNPALWITNSTLTLTGCGNLSMTNSGTTPVVSGNSGSLSTSGYTGNLNFSSTGSNAITNCTDVTLETTGALTIDGSSSDATICSKNNVTLKGGTVSLTNSSGGQLVNAGGASVSVTATNGDLSLTGSTPLSPLLIADSGEQGASGTVTLSASGNISVTNNGSGMTVCGALTAAANGNVTLKSTSGCVVGGSLTVTKAADVTVTGASNTIPTIIGATDITADGEISITNTGSSMAVVGALAVSKAQNITVTSAGSNPTIGGMTDITADGNVSITNTGSGMAAGNNLIATSKNGSVTVEGKHASAPAISGTAAITAAKDITITSASTTDIGDTATFTAGGLVIRAKSVGTTITKDGIQISAPYGGDASGGLNLSTSAPATTTLYTAGSGYALFTPADGGTPATLVLHNATIKNTTANNNSIGPEHEGIALPAENITIQVEGTNNIKSSTSYGIGSGTNLTLSGDGVLTADGGYVEGIWLAVGSLTFASGANVTLNSVVVIPDENKIQETTVYGNVTVKSGEEIADYQLKGAVTIDGGAVLTVPADETLWLDNTKLITINGQIVSNGTIALPYNYTVQQIQAFNLPGSVWLYDRDADKYKIYVNGSICADGGDVSSNGLNLYNNTPVQSTYYKAGDGYIIFTPAQGDAITELLLHNASMNVQESEGAGLILLPAGTVNIRVSGENKLSVNAKYANGVYSDKYNPTNLTITSSDHGTLEISVSGTGSAVALGGPDGDLASLIIGGNASVTATASGQNAICTTLTGKLTVETGAKFTARGDVIDLAVLGDPSSIQNFDGVAVFLNRDTLNYKFQVYGNCDLPGFLSANPIGSIENEGNTFHTYLNVTHGSTLTIPVSKTLTVNDLSTLTNSGTIVNNGTVILPAGSNEAAIKTLKLTGTGVVRVITANDANGAPTAWDTYTNDGVAVKAIIGGLDLTTDSHSGKTVADDGYSWDAASHTLTLGNNAYVSDGITLPDNTTVNTTSGSTINGTISGPGGTNMHLTFTGTAPLTINGGISLGATGDTVTVQNGAHVTVNGSFSLGAYGLDGILNVNGPGTMLSISSSNSYAVMCGAVNVQNGASLATKAEGTGSVGIKAMKSGGVSVTGGSTLTAGCDYGVFIMNGKLTVDDTSKLITNGAVAPFCIIDTTSTKALSDVLSLAGTPSDTEIASVKGTTDFSGSKHTYWSVIPKNGSLGVKNEEPDFGVLTGAKTETLTFVKAAAPGDNSGGDNSSGDNSSGDNSSGDNSSGGNSSGGNSSGDNSSGGNSSGGNNSSRGGSGGSISYTLYFETNGGTKISSISKDSGSTVDLANYKATREGYEFGGWYSDQATTEKVTNVKLTKNTTVYAKWTKKPAKAVNPFADVSENAYYHDAVLWAVQKNVTSGTTNAAFSPDMICTRAQAVTFLWRTMGSPEPTSENCPFTDVSKDTYYYKAVLWAVEKGITVGTTSTTFRPGDTMTRGQAVTFLWRAAGKPSVTSVNPFADVSKDAYYYNAMLWAVEKGITQGTSSVTFSPSGSCTRSQVVTFLYRYAY